MGEQEERLSFEEMLTKDVGSFWADPLGYVMYAFPWGEPGGPLEEHDGPDEWQAKQLHDIGERFRVNPKATIREAIASGHGIGKSTEVSWIILWAMSTRVDLRGVVTASTLAQLTTKTWAELALWHKRAVNKHWFKWTATKFFRIGHDATWFVSAQPNNPHNSDAFAGLHAKDVLVIFDEASGVDDIIWQVAEGAMTTPRAMWFVFGNPTKNTGRFKDCFTTDKRWGTRNIDSRTCKMTNKEELAEQIAHYGIDSDFVRIRILGVFPRLGSMQFISSETVDMAMLREHEAEVYLGLPKVMGVDVARYGDDKTVITIIQGRKLIEQIKMREKSTMEVAMVVAIQIKKHRPAATFVDGVGVGGGVVDRLHQLGYDVIEVNAGSAPMDDVTYYNKRAEMWGRMRDWLKTADLAGPQREADKELVNSLIGLTYTFDEKERIRLERKKDMKARGLPSPDEADSLSFCFAEIIADFSVRGFEPAEDGSFEPS